MDLSILYDQYGSTFYGQLMKCCDHKEDIAEQILTRSFKIAHENILTFNPGHGSQFAWLFRILIGVARENGYPIILDIKAFESNKS